MKKKILYSIGSLAIASVSSLVVLSCAKSSSSDNAVDINTDIKNSNPVDLKTQKELVNFFKNENKNNLKIDADVKIGGKAELDQEIKKAMKNQYKLTSKQISYIEIEESYGDFSSFNIGNFKEINIGIKVNNEKKEIVKLKVGQFAKMIDLKIDLNEIKKKALEARELNIENNATKEDSNYLQVPEMAEDKNIIAVLTDVNGDYKSSDFVQYANFNEYEAAKAKYSIDHNSTNQSSENNKKTNRMLYNKLIKTPVLVSVRKSQYLWNSISDDEKLKNSFDYLRLAFNLSTREILLNVWEDIEDFALKNINDKASGILTEIKRITNLENTIRESDYENISAYKEDLNQQQKTSFKEIIQKMINPLIDQLSDENISSVKRLINKLGSIPTYIKDKHNEIVEYLDSLNARVKKFKIHNLKFYKGWKNSGWGLDVLKYDDSKKVRYSRYLVDVVSSVPKIFDTSHSKYVNPLAHAIGKTFKKIIEDNLHNMPLSKELLNTSYSLYAFENFVNDLFKKFKDTKPTKINSLDDPNVNYDGTIINYTKKLITNFFIFNNKFIENFDKFTNVDEQNKEWYNIKLKNDAIDAYMPEIWDWIKTWENTTNKTFVELMKAIKDDLTNNASKKPLSVIKLEIVNGETNLYVKKINLVSFFKNLPNSLFSNNVDRWENENSVDDLKAEYEILINNEINKVQFLNTSIKGFWNNFLKPKINDVETELKSMLSAPVVGYSLTWPVFKRIINSESILDFAIKQAKPVFEELLPVLKDFGNTLFKVINGEGGIYGGVDVHYLSSLILRIERLYNNYYNLEYSIAGVKIFSMSDLLPNLTKTFKLINKEFLKYSKWLEPVNEAFAPIKD